MLFPKRQDVLPQVTGLALGSAPREFTLPRNLPIESIMVRVNFTTTAAMATLNAEGLIGIVQRLQLNVQDGAQNRTVVDVTGGGLIEECRNVTGLLDRSTILALPTANGAATAYQITYPIFFADPRLDDPISSMLLLPAPRFTIDPVLKITLATQAQMDVNVAPTFAAAAGVTINVTINYRQVEISRWPVLNQEIAEMTKNFSATIVGDTYDIPVAGAYTLIMYRGFTTNAVRGDLGSGAPIKLTVLGMNVRTAKFPDLVVENDFSAGSQVIGGSAAFDFLTDKPGSQASDLGSVLDMNRFINSGAKLQMVHDVAAVGTGTKANVYYRRIFGNIQRLKKGVARK